MTQELKDAGAELLRAAYAYWKAYQKTLGSGAVIWLEDTDGKLVIFTRGEYRQQLMSNIAPLSKEHPL